MSLLGTVQRALPLMNPEQRAEAEQILAELGSTANDGSNPTLDDAKRMAAAAFERDMQPVTGAIVEALNAGDLHALQGLRALLPKLLEEVNAQPALADLLTYQLGRAVLRAMGKPEGGQ